MAVELLPTQQRGEHLRFYRPRKNSHFWKLLGTRGLCSDFPTRSRHREKPRWQPERF